MITWEIKVQEVGKSVSVEQSVFGEEPTESERRVSEVVSEALKMIDKILTKNSGGKATFVESQSKLSSEIIQAAHELHKRKFE